MKITIEGDGYSFTVAEALDPDGGELAVWQAALETWIVSSGQLTFHNYDFSQAWVTNLLRIIAGPLPTDRGIAFDTIADAWAELTAEKKALTK